MKTQFKFEINQIVKGKACGTFVVLGYREIAGKWFVQLKSICPETHKPFPGEMALCEDKLENINNYKSA